MVKKKKRLPSSKTVKSTNNDDSKLYRNIKIIIWLSIFGILVSSYLTYTHYSDEEDPFCKALGGGCEVVSKGPWSEIDGILMEDFGIFVDFPLPVSIIGLLGFVITIILAGMILNEKCFNIKNTHICKTGLVKLLFWLNLAGLPFAIYLTYVEFIVLDTFCIYCDVSKTLFLIVLITCGINLKYAKKRKIIKGRNVCEYC